MNALSVALQGVGQIGLDTPPIIYYVEEHLSYDPGVRQVFDRLRQRTLQGVTSVVSLAEVLVRPKAVGDTYLKTRYRSLLLGSAFFYVYPITAQIAEAAADLRARYNLRLGYALQLAVAIEQGCQAFLTNDLRLKRVTELRILVLEELQP